jgi:aspartyl-tRNA(Asn)/glutamyl-tRNA(Gln) amidotransferase subunit A
MTEALHFLTIAEAARRLEAKTLSPVALVEALLDRIEALDAFVTLMAEQALEAARRAEAEIVAGHYAPPTPAGTLDVASQDFIAGLAARAGLTLDESQLAFLYQAAPDAFAMADRLRQPIPWSDEPANTFRFPA